MIWKRWLKDRLESKQTRQHALLLVLAIGITGSICGIVILNYYPKQEQADMIYDPLKNETYRKFMDLDVNFSSIMPTSSTTTTTTKKSSTTKIKKSTTTSSSTTQYQTTIPLPVYTQGGDYYSTKPNKIDFKWQKCNPFENVSLPMEYIKKYSNKTYNFTYLNGTIEVRYKANETEYKTIKGGCITVSANCCRVEDGGTSSPINAKLYAKYYEEVLGGCDDKPIVCPMAMTEKYGRNPQVACLEGRCQIVGMN